MPAGSMKIMRTRVTRHITAVTTETHINGSDEEYRHPREPE